jgi:ribosomal-protein-alanine N-acetyltransferase
MRPSGMAIRIETKRLLIEPFVAVDAGDLFAWASDFDTTKYMGWKRHETLADSEAVIAYFDQVKESEPPRFDRPLVIREKGSGRALGSTGIHQMGPGVVELGWILRVEARRQGYAREAAEAVLGFAMGLDWVKRVEARAHPENETSIRLMRGLGMRELEGAMPQLGGELVRMVKYGVVKPI